MENRYTGLENRESMEYAKNYNRMIVEEISRYLDIWILRL